MRQWSRTPPSPGRPRRNPSSPDERAELERLRAETAELHGQAGPGGPGARLARSADGASAADPTRRRPHCSRLRARSGSRGRRIGLNLVSNTSRYVATVQPLIDDPAIQNVLTDRITNQITSRLDVTGLVYQSAAQVNSKGLTQISSLLTTFGSQMRARSTASSTARFSRSSPAKPFRGLDAGLYHRAPVAGQRAVWSERRYRQHQERPDRSQSWALIAVAKQQLLARGFSLANYIPTVNATVPLFEA